MRDQPVPSAASTPGPSERDLRVLLDALAPQLPDPPPELAGWQIARIQGGQNNLLYRAERATSAVAVKFTRRDARDRAGREHAALRVMASCLPGLAPEPLLLDRERSAHPVVVQSWLDGACRAEPPATTDAWRRLVGHYRAIHTVRPHHAPHDLPDAVVSLRTADDAVARLQNGFRQLPPEAASADLADLVHAALATAWPRWEAPIVALCRTDPNPLNLLRRPGAWASVDWENSGWGDPAFEIADLMAHPAYTQVADATWQTVIAMYCDGLDDRSCAQRIRVFHALQLADWAVFFARKAHEYADGAPPPARLASRPASWYATLPAQAAHYQRAAASALAAWREGVHG